MANTDKGKGVIVAYVDVQPTSLAAEEQMLACAERIRELLRTCIQHSGKVPDTDILVMLHMNTVLVQDPRAVLYGVVPSLVIKIHTSDQELQPQAVKLREGILEAWEETFGSSYPIEIWISFFHTWGTNINPA